MTPFEVLPCDSPAERHNGRGLADDRSPREGFGADELECFPGDSLQQLRGPHLRCSGFGIDVFASVLHLEYAFCEPQADREICVQAHDHVDRVALQREVGQRRGPCGEPFEVPRGPTKPREP